MGRFFNLVSIIVDQWPQALFIWIFACIAMIIVRWSHFGHMDSCFRCRSYLDMRTIFHVFNDWNDPTANVFRHRNQNKLDLVFVVSYLKCNDITSTTHSSVLLQQETESNGTTRLNHSMHHDIVLLSMTTAPSSINTFSTPVTVTC